MGCYMELIVKNVGKIDNAKVEVNGVTVITGYNSTGKSTICRALYAIMDTFSNINSKVLFQRQSSIISAIYNWHDNLLDEGINEDIGDKIVEMLVFYITNKKNIEDVESLYAKLNEICEELKIEISEKTIHILIEKYQEIITKDKEEYVQFIISRNIKNVFKNQLNHVNYKRRQVFIEIKENKKTWAMVFKENNLLKYNCKYITLKKPIYIEPQSILDNYDGNVYPFIRRKDDGIQEFLLFDENQNDKVTLEEYQERQENVKLINQILQDVTKGQLVANQGRSLAYAENGLKENIVCSNVASGLKSFLIIQRMIANGALGSGRVLIIDEPEVNLHPEWQLMLAKVLVLLNKKLNIKVVLSTHSPYFLRAVECYMNEYENDANGKYYLTVETENQLYTLEDVTNNRERIYKALYRPLEEIN